MLCKQCNLPYPSGSSDAENAADFCSQSCMDKWYQTLVEVNKAIATERLYATPIERYIPIAYRK